MSPTGLVRASWALADLTVEELHLHRKRVDEVILDRLRAASDADELERKTSPGIAWDEQTR